MHGINVVMNIINYYDTHFHCSQGEIIKTNYTMVIGLKISNKSYSSDNRLINNKHRQITI